MAHGSLAMLLNGQALGNWTLCNPKQEKLKDWRTQKRFEILNLFSLNKFVFDREQQTPDVDYNCCENKISFQISFYSLKLFNIINSTEIIFFGLIFQQSLFIQKQL